ncbi:AAA-like domain-containing protein [Nostoc sp.]|uniref:WD40 domain-containing protein n=1 Tax=Nostoc sp. TaxID=1180 RepID=UPI002FF958C2
MRADRNSGYSYILGGSLAVNDSTYVERQADIDFYNELKNGEYCYVLNSRQMGKSSLRVQTMHKLQLKGIVCAEIDLSSIEINITAQAWYGAIVYKLITGFKLNIDRRTWNREHDHLSPMQYFNEFIERILLTEFSQHIVIFIDEIDTLLKLDFGDDFLAFIRACYNKRSDNPEYRRLTFSLIGSTSPSNLIKDKERTPFNIGKSISLEGFHEDELEPLKTGLYKKSSHPERVMREIFYWTRGQPFLTQKLCKLILTADSSPLAGSEREWVKNLVRSQVIKNWDSQDEPQHLRTIRDRLLSNEQHASRLLELYQQILQHKEVKVDNSPKQMELRLSGLVAKQDDKLRVFNPIYKYVFNHKWVEKELANRHPLLFSEALKRWEGSNRQEKSWLLRGQALRDAKKWAKGRSLTDSDREFLDASQELENEEVLRRNEEIRRKKLIKWLTLGVGVITTLLVISITLGVLTYVQSQSIQARSLFEQAESITQPDLLPVRVALSIEGIERSDSVSLKPFLYNDLALLRRFQSLEKEKNKDKKRGSVNTIAFSKDGKYLATAGLDNTISGDGYVCVFKRSNNQWFDYSYPCENKIGNVNAIAFSPNEKYLATASVDGKACVWETTSGKRKFCYHNVDNTIANTVSFSPDGEYLVTAWADGKVLVFNTNGYKLINPKTHDKMRHDKSVVAMTFSNDGQYLATASLDGTASVWNDWKRQKNDEEPVKLLHKGSVTDVSSRADGKFLVPVTDVSFSPDGKFLATVSSGDKNAYVWDTISRKIVQQLKHDDNVLAVTFSHNGQYLATASLDKTARVWNAKSGKELFKLKHGELVTDVTFSSDDKYLGTTSRDKTARIWEIPTGDEFARLIHKDEVNAIAFSPGPDTKYLTTASLDGTTHVWDIKSDKSNRTITLIRHREKINAMAFSEKNDYLATVSKENTVRVWSTSSGDKEKEFLPPEKLKGLVTSVALSSDAKYLATVNLYGSAQLWQILSKSAELINIKDPELDDQYFKAVVFSPDGNYLAMVSKNGSACVLKTTGDRKKIGCIEQVVTEEQALLSHWMISPNFKGIFNGFICQFIPHLCNTKEQALVETMAFSPDSKSLAMGSRDGKVQVLKMPNLEKLDELQKEGQPVTAVVFSPDGKYLATVSSDDTARIWEVSSEKLVAEMKHNGIVTDVSFNKDSKYLATASQDKTVRVWETTNEKMPVQTILYDKPVTNVAFILDETDHERLAIISGETNSDKTTHVLIWQKLKYPCDYLTRNLTEKEWHQYYGDNEKYYKKCSSLP